MKISELFQIISSFLEELLNMEIYESFSLKGNVEFDQMTIAEEEEKHLNTEEISILLLYKYD